MNVVVLLGDQDPNLPEKEMMIKAFEMGDYKDRLDVIEYQGKHSWAPPDITRKGMGILINKTLFTLMTRAKVEKNALDQYLLIELALIAGRSLEKIPANL